MDQGKQASGTAVLPQGVLRKSGAAWPENSTPVPSQPKPPRQSKPDLLSPSLLANRPKVAKAKISLAGRRGKELWSLARNKQSVITTVNHDQERKHQQMLYGTGSRIVAPDSVDKPRFLFHPEGVLRKWWDVFQVIFLGYVAVVVPLRIGFDVVVDSFSAGWWTELVVDIYFILDIGVNFRTKVRDGNNFLIEDIKKIRKKYLLGWFLVDVLACLPVSYVQMITDAVKNSGSASTKGQGGDNLKALKVLRLFRLAKLLRLARLKRLIKQYEEQFEGLMSSSKLLGLCLCILYSTHVCGSMWYLVGSSDQAEPNGEITQGWVGRIHDGRWPSWKNLEHVPFYKKYLTSFYWAMTALSTVGFGDIVPLTDAELLFASFAELFGCMIFGMLIGVLSTLVMGGKALEEKIDNQMAELREFMQEKGVPQHLRKRVKQYMETLYRKKTAYNEKEVLDSLPPALAAELLEAMYRDTIDMVPLFRGLEVEVLNQLCIAMKPFFAMAGDYVYRQGELGKDLFIIISGMVEMTRDSHKLGVLTDGSFFGETAILDKGNGGNSRRERSAKAVTNCELGFLSKDDVMPISEDFPVLGKRIVDLAGRRQREDTRVLNKMLKDNPEEGQVALSTSLAFVGTLVNGDESTTIMSSERMAEYEAALQIQKTYRGSLARKSFQVNKRRNRIVAEKGLAVQQLANQQLKAGLEAFWLSKNGDGCEPETASRRQRGAFDYNEEAKSMRWSPFEDSSATAVDSDATVLEFSVTAISHLSYGRRAAPPWEPALHSLVDYQSATMERLAMEDPEWHRFSIRTVACNGDEATDMYFVVRDEENLLHALSPRGESTQKTDNALMDWLLGVDMVCHQLRSTDYVCGPLTEDGSSSAEREKEVPVDKQTDDAMQRAFDAIDVDKNDALDQDEVMQVCRTLGEAVDSTQMEALFSEMDEDRDGTVTSQEFKRWFLRSGEHSIILANTSGDSLLKELYVLRGDMILARVRWKLRWKAIQGNIDEQKQRQSVLMKKHTQPHLFGMGSPMPAGRVHASALPSPRGNCDIDVQKLTRQMGEMRKIILAMETRMEANHTSLSAKLDTQMLHNISDNR